MTDISWISTLRDGGDVQRFHTMNLIKTQDVAQHSFSCALLAEHFGQMIDDVDPAKVMLHMLIHDIPETGIGDVPWATKRENPELNKQLNAAEERWASKNMPSRIFDSMYMEGFTENEKLLCRLVDQFEALLKGIEELRMGNKTMRPMVDKMVHHCGDMIYLNKDFNVLSDFMIEVTEVAENASQ